MCRDMLCYREIPSAVVSGLKMDGGIENPGTYLMILKKGMQSQWIRGQDIYEPGGCFLKVCGDKFDLWNVLKKLSIAKINLFFEFNPVW